MLGRSGAFRAAAILVLVAVIIASLVTIDRRPATPVAVAPATIPSPAQDDLSTELRRCSALGPQDPEDARCVAVWEENRRRFLGRPARPLPPQTSLGTAAPATPAKEDAR
jgi:conjugative transfer region protein TrbK